MVLIQANIPKCRTWWRRTQMCSRMKWTPLWCSKDFIRVHKVILHNKTYPSSCLWTTQTSTIIQTYCKTSQTYNPTNLTSRGSNKWAHDGCPMHTGVKYIHTRTRATGVCKNPTLQHWGEVLGQQLVVGALTIPMPTPKWRPQHFKPLHHSELKPCPCTPKAHLFTRQCYLSG